MVVMLLMALIVFVSILIVGYPLVNPERYQYETQTNGDEPLENLLSARDVAFDAIRDLDFDHKTGKLSDQDYNQMRPRYDQKAAEVLQKMDALTASRKPRSENGKSTSQKAAVDRRNCPKCHAQVQANDRFCPKCGNPLS